MKNHGRLRFGNTKRGTLAERLRARTIEQPGCWGWRGYVNDKGYARLWAFGEQIYAHRLSWEVHRGAIPDGLSVLHRCDNGLCTNPDHLFLGTALDNMQDAARKGRHRLQRRPEETRGERHPGAKLTEAQVRAIRSDPRSERLTGAAFGISPALAGMIKRRELWAHLGETGG